jgi:hypothetical protein
MIVETHCHTSEHSPCSHVAAVDLVPRACEAGVQTIVLTYLDRTDDPEEDFPAHVDLFKARTCLSILHYLAKVQMGDTEESWRIPVEAERSLATVAAG